MENGEAPWAREFVPAHCQSRSFLCPADPRAGGASARRVRAGSAERIRKPSGTVSGPKLSQKRTLRGSRDGFGNKKRSSCDSEERPGVAPGKEKRNMCAKHANFWKGYWVCAFWQFSPSERQRWKMARRLRLGGLFLRVVNLGPSYAPLRPPRGGSKCKGGYPLGVP